MKKLAGLGTIALSALLLTGCPGKPAGPEVVNVEGTVTVEGEPMEGLRVEFWPEGAGFNSGGTTDANGHFVLEAADASGKMGAVVGTHKVSIRDLSVIGKFMGRASEEHSFGKDPRISTIYASQTTSGLMETVNGPRTDITFDIRPYDPEEATRLAEEAKNAVGGTGGGGAEAGGGDR